MFVFCFLGQDTVGFIFSFLQLFCHEHTLDHSVFIPLCMQEYIWLFGCVCVCFLFYGVHLKHAWLYWFNIFMILFIGIEELTAISSSYLWRVLFLNWIEFDSVNASQRHPPVSVSDSSPAHGESQDEVLRRRHGDKEVNFNISQITPYRQCFSKASYVMNEKIIYYT